MQLNVLVTQHTYSMYSAQQIHSAVSTSDGCSSDHPHYDPANELIPARVDADLLSVNPYHVGIVSREPAVPDASPAGGFCGPVYPGGVVTLRILGGGISSSERLCSEKIRVMMAANCRSSPPRR